MITKICTSHLEADGNNAITELNLVLNADTICSDRVYLKRWKDSDKTDFRPIKVKEELKSAKCDPIEFSGRL